VTGEGHDVDHGLFVVQVFDQAPASLLTNRLSSKCYAVAERTHRAPNQRALNWAAARLDDISRVLVHCRTRQRLKETTGG
jgi:hypothetical protein